MDLFRMRIEAINLLRVFFREERFDEVETPIIVRYPGMEPNLNPVKAGITIENNEQAAYLITSPEYYMKRLLAKGYKKIWQLNSAFRDGEEKSPFHNLEFKMLEYYMADSDYHNMADLTEKLVVSMAKSISRSKSLKFKNIYLNRNFNINFDQQFERLTCSQAFRKYANLNLEELYEDKDRFVDDAIRKGIDVRNSESTADIFQKIMLLKIEPNLGTKKPTFLFDYPAELAALSKIKDDNSLFCERFELYIGGIEIGNAFSELTDPKEQLDRLKKEQEQRKRLNKEIYEIDREFIDALQYMPERCSGIAVGFDRLVMILFGAQKVSDVILFPTGKIFT